MVRFAFRVKIYEIFRHAHDVDFSSGISPQCKTPW